MTIEHIWYSFDINYKILWYIFGYSNDLKSKKFKYKVIDLVKYYNFDIKFVFIGHHMRKL